MLELILGLCSSHTPSVDPVGNPFLKIQTSKRVFQKLHIPELVSGKSFNLNLHTTKKSFWSGATTKTYAYNNESFWGPTLVFNKGETVQINVKNELDEPTTTHWHGFHIPAAMDGGPHQIVEAGKTWSPKFKVDNNAGTYWYHPHAHETTQKQLTYGAGGLIIIKDSIESKLALPRNYGIDDIPLVMTSRRFLLNDEFSFRGESDKYGDYQLINGTMDPEVTLPNQMVRLRLLNAEIERGYNIGFPDESEFYVIATDGGLVDKPIPVKRMKLMAGERVEILVDLSKNSLGDKVDLFTYNAGQGFGFPGGEPGTTPPNGSYLNNLNYRLLRINVGERTKNPILSLPTVLTSNTFPTKQQVNRSRTIQINGMIGPPEREFYFDGQYYDMHTINQVIKLGDVEEWTVSNDRVFGHSFHIHDVQFKITSRSDGPVPAYEQGWKDTVYVPRNAKVSFVAKFDDFASDSDAFMYHCHMSNHEDGGLMGQFLVSKNPAGIPKYEKNPLFFRAKTEHPITETMLKEATQLAGSSAPKFEASNSNGKMVNLQDLSQSKPIALVFIEKECPCSKDATPFYNQIQAAFGDKAKVVGVINATASYAAEWAKKIGWKGQLVSDPELKIINAYNAKGSIYTSLIAANGTIVKSYPGYSRDMLSELNNKLASLVKITAPTLKLSQAPKDMVAGCPFPAIDEVKKKTLNH